MVNSEYLSSSDPTNSTGIICFVIQPIFKSHSLRLLTSQTANARVQRGRARQSDVDEKCASRPPLQRLVRRATLLDDSHREYDFDFDCCNDLLAHFSQSFLQP